MRVCWKQYLSLPLTNLLFKVSLMHIFSHKYHVSVFFLHNACLSNCVIIHSYQYILTLFLWKCTHFFMLNLFFYVCHNLTLKMKVTDFDYFSYSLLFIIYNEQFHMFINLLWWPILYSQKNNFLWQPILYSQKPNNN